MNTFRPIILFMALAVLAQPAAAQRSERTTATGSRVPVRAAEIVPGAPQAETGTVEFGLFGQLTYLGEDGDFNLDSRSAFAFGARLGLFLTPTWSVELDAVGADADLEGGGSIDYTALSARLNYNFTLTEFHPSVSLLVGGGITRAEYEGGDPSRSDDKWGASALGGIRLALLGPLTARGDIVADIIPSSINLGARIGFGVLFGTRGISSERDRDRDAGAAEPTPVPPLPPAPPEPQPIAEEENRDAALAGVDTIPLSESIYFDYDRVDIRADAIPVLERKIRWLQANPRLQLRIEGHADDRGQDEYNLSLSQRRAAETQAFLVARGISSDRLPIVGYGEEYKNCIQEPMTEPCHQQNRRADFRILRVGAPRLQPPR